MRHLRSRSLILVASSGSIAALTLLLVAGPAGGRTARNDATLVKKTIVTVTAGRPSELRFTLSKSVLPSGTVVFKVTNRGNLSHDFKLCTHPMATNKANTCTGKVTRLLRPGQSASLTVTLTKKARFEYLCTVPGHAAAGMKGLVRVTSTASTPPKKAATAGKFTVAQVAAGKSVFHSAGCGNCHTLKAAGTHGTTGPNLNSIKPAYAAIVAQVTSGGRFMPPFGASVGGSLNTTQIKNVAAFVYTSEH